MPESSVTRKQLADRLNEDLSREYQAIIAYVVYSQALKGAEYMNIAGELEQHAKEELQHALKIARHVERSQDVSRKETGGRVEQRDSRKDQSSQRDIAASGFHKAMIVRCHGTNGTNGTRGLSRRGAVSTRHALSRQRTVSTSPVSAAEYAKYALSWAGTSRFPIAFTGALSWQRAELWRAVSRWSFPTGSGAGAGEAATPEEAQPSPVAKVIYALAA